jgi:hypothetical protein
MQGRQHSTVREGLVVGLLGALVLAAWYFVFDLAAGQPLRTPHVLGRLFFRGDLPPGGDVDPGIVAGYTVLHLLMFGLAGIGLTLLIHLAARNLALRMGVWLGLVLSFLLFAGLTYMATAATGEQVPLWSVGAGTLAAVAAMGWHLVRRHPRIRTDAQLGGEATPHSPAPPRVR